MKLFFYQNSKDLLTYNYNNKIEFNFMNKIKNPIPKTFKFNIFNNNFVKKYF